MGNKRSRPHPPISDSDAAQSFAEQIGPHNAFARWAYRCIVLGLVPGLGLVAGPAAVILGFVVRRRAGRNPDYQTKWLARSAILLGAVLTVTTWLGLYLMIRGLRQG